MEVSLSKSSLVKLCVIWLLVMSGLVYLESSIDTPEFDREEWEEQTEMFSSQIAKEQWIKQHCFSRGDQRICD